MNLFLRQVGTLFTGTVLAQVINLLAYPLLTRTYSTAAFGEFALFLSTASIVGTVACLRFDVVVQAAPFAQRRAAHRLGVVFSAAVSLITALVHGALFPAGTGGGSLIAALLGIAIFFTGYTLSAQALLIKHERYRASAAAQVARTLLTALPQVVLFWLLPDALGLIVGYCLGGAVQGAIQARSLADVPARRIGWRRMVALWRRYRVYPLFDLPSALLATAALNAGNYFIFDLFGASDAGVFALAFRLAALPLALVGSNLSEVYFQKASLAYAKGESLWPWLRFNLRLSGGLALLMILGIALLARPVIDLYLGHDWARVGDVLFALAPMMALRLVAVAVGATPLVLRRPQWSLIANAGLLAALVGSWLAARVLALGFMDFLWLTSLASVAVYIVYILFLAYAVLGGGHRSGRRPVTISPGVDGTAA